MAIPEKTLRELAAVGRDLYQLGMVSSRGGNLSILDGHAMWITGTGTALGHLKALDISRAFADGRHEPPPPSSDTILHWTIYATTQAGAIAHAHPHHAIALSYDRDVFKPEDLEGQMHVPSVPVIERGPLQEQQIADAPARVARGAAAGARRLRARALALGRAPLAHGPRRERPHRLASPGRRPGLKEASTSHPNGCSVAGGTGCC